MTQLFATRDTSGFRIQGGVRSLALPSHAGLTRAGLSRSGLSRAGRVGFRMLATLALAGGFVAFAGVAGDTPAVAADGACDGVTVVVDFTDLGGELDVRCAEGDPETGRDALAAAGFAATDSQPGFLCAINSMPDPCPETFDGNFWSYWHSAPDGEWASYQVGADSSSPVVGEMEGWRYNDGAEAPGIAPADAAARAAAPSPEPSATETPGVSGPSSDQAVTSNAFAEQQAHESNVLTIVAVSFFALIAALVLLFVARRRRNGLAAGGSAADGSRSDGSAEHGSGSSD